MIIINYFRLFDSVSAFAGKCCPSNTKIGLIFFANNMDTNRIQ